MSVLCDLLSAFFKHSFFLIMADTVQWLHLHLSSTDGHLYTPNEAFEEMVYHQVSLIYNMSYIFFP